MAMRPTHRHVLVVAGSDSSGGAGVARDVATLSHFGVPASLAITAVTAQTHAEVVSAQAVRASHVAAQMRAALAANPIGSIKLGMLATAEIVEAVAEVLTGFRAIPVVLDPVVASTSGARLLSGLGVESLCDKLLPLASLVTPNLPELAVLTGSNAARSEGEIETQAVRLIDRGPSNVLVKGGHARGRQSIDTFFTTGSPPRHFASPRRDATLRGTGCMLSSAIAAHLSLDLDVASAITRAKAFMDQQFAAAEQRVS